MTTTEQQPQMTTTEKSAKITAYFLHHRSNGMTVDEAVDHIAVGLDIERGTVLVAIHYFLTH